MIKYFANFARNADTAGGGALMQARVDFVEQHYQGPLVDVGIGSGAIRQFGGDRIRPRAAMMSTPAGSDG
jgi:hypothetical protein